MKIMGKIEKIDALKKCIKDNFEEKEYEEMFIELIQEFKDKLGFRVAFLMMQIVFTAYKDLEGDFKLLRKACSENFTLNKAYSQKELEKSRECGAGFAENTSMKHIILASTRFNKEDFPEYLPNTNKFLLPKISDKEIESAKETKKFLLRKDNDYYS